jgi:hypothetical protein
MESSVISKVDAPPFATTGCRAVGMKTTFIAQALGLLLFSLLTVAGAADA